MAFLLLCCHVYGKIHTDVGKQKKKPPTNCKAPEHTDPSLSQNGTDKLGKLQADRDLVISFLLLLSSSLSISWPLEASSEVGIICLLAGLR